MDARFEEGRTASPETLEVSLGSASPRYLEGALLNPALTERHLLRILGNPALASPIIQRISQNRAWLKPYEVKSAIVLHVRTPRAVAMNLVSFLWWRDLVRVIERTQLAPPLRRTAEKILSIRLAELAVGEKITLARIAHRGVINALRGEENPMIVRALLQNPRLVEGDALAIASSQRTPSSILRVLSEDGRWSPRPAIRKAIARNPETPPAIALHMVQTL